MPEKWEVVLDKLLYADHPSNGRHMAPEWTRPLSSLASEWRATVIHAYACPLPPPPHPWFRKPMLFLMVARRLTVASRYIPMPISPASLHLTIRASHHLKSSPEGQGWGHDNSLRERESTFTLTFLQYIVKTSLFYSYLFISSLQITFLIDKAKFIIGMCV